MAISLNKVQLIGHCGKDVDLKYTQGGTPYGKFSVATSSSYKDKAGEWIEKTEWTNIVLWGPLAENAQKHLHKGSKVYIEGRLETSSWDDKKSGEKKYMTNVVGSQFINLDPKSSNGESSERASSRSQRSPEPQEITDEDIPF